MTTKLIHFEKMPNDHVIDLDAMYKHPLYLSGELLQELTDLAIKRGEPLAVVIVECFIEKVNQSGSKTSPD